MTEIVCRNNSTIYPNEIIKNTCINVSDKSTDDTGIDSLIKKHKKSNSIRIKSDIFDLLKDKKRDLKKDWGKGTYDMAIRSILKELEEIKEENEKLLEDKKSDIKEIEYQKKLVFNLSERTEKKEKKEKNVQLSDLPPPPPSCKAEIKQIKRIEENITFVETPNIKFDHRRELLEIFKGGIISPSKVLAKTNPKHSKAKLVKINFIPNLKAISTAQKYGEREKTL